METFRSSCVGVIIRAVTRHRVLQYPEERAGYVFKAPIQPESRPLSRVPTVASAGNEDGLQLARLGTAVSRATLNRTNSAGSAGLEKQRIEDSADVVTWNDENDPENPQHWTTTKKMLVSSQIWLLTFSIYIGSAIYSPGIPNVASTFGVSNVVATLGLTLFVLGYGLGPMIWSPLSELPQIGRAPIYVITLGIFVFLQFAVIYAQNFGMLLAFRFITGFIGSPCLATGGASMGDIWSPRIRDYMIGIWGAFAISAPVLGPTIGGFAAAAYGWTWTIWPLLWVSGFTFVILIFFLPETYAPAILYQKARRVRNATGETNWRCEMEIEMASTSSKDILFEALVRPFQLTLLEPIVFVTDLYVALIYGILYIFFEAFPIVFQEKRGFNSGEGGLAFLGLLVSTCCIVLPAYFWWKYKYQSKHFDANGNLAPERQLPPAALGAVTLPVALLWFGWTGNFASVHWIVPILATMLFSVGGCLIFNCIFCYQAHAYPQYAASVLAGNDCMRSSFGAGFPLFATAMFHNLGTGWACTLLACLTVLFIPYPFILLKYGKRLRMASKFARHDI